MLTQLPGSEPTSDSSRTALTTTPVVSADDEFRAELLRECLTEGPAEIDAIQKAFQAFCKNTADAALLQDPFRRVHTLAGNAGLGGLQTVARVGGALENLLKELGEKPERVLPSVLRTVAQGIDLLAKLYQNVAVAETDPTPGIEVLALDDQDIALRSVKYSLDKANLKATCVNDPAVALKTIGEKQFDLVVSDIEMPGMNGMEFCAKLRTQPRYGKTPVIFVTTAADFEHRARVLLSGGTDLIAKPFLYTELALKALIFVLAAKLAPER
jgi:CheY-like chemotaxis protein